MTRLSNAASHVAQVYKFGSYTGVGGLIIARGGFARAFRVGSADCAVVVCVACGWFALFRTPRSCHPSRESRRAEAHMGTYLVAPYGYHRA